MANSGIDIRRERGSGPEVRRTTGGMLYRVSRTNTPDLMEIRRELDRQREREDASARKSEAANTVESSSANTQYSPHPPHSPPAGRQTAKSALESFAWIQHGLSVSLAGSKKMAPSNTATVQRNAGSGRSTAGEHHKQTSSGHSIDCINQHQSLSTAAVRPQTARQHTLQEPLQVLQKGASVATPRRPQTARPASSTLRVTYPSPHQSKHVLPAGGQEVAQEKATLTIDVSEQALQSARAYTHTPSLSHTHTNTHKSDDKTQGPSHRADCLGFHSGQTSVLKQSEFVGGYSGQTSEFVGGYSGQTSVLRPRRVGDAPPPPPSEAQAKLRDALASMEGRWAGLIQTHSDSIAARASAERHEAATVGGWRLKKNKMRAGSTADSTGTAGLDPLVAAARKGAILPFAAPAWDDVWERKAFDLDPEKTSAGLTQDLIKWSKFEGRYEKGPPTYANNSSTVELSVREQEAKVAREFCQAERAHAQELKKATDKVREALATEKKTDSARFHAMVRAGWTEAHRSYEDALHLDLRRGLSNAKKRLDEVVLERDELKAAAEIMEHRCKALQERCASLEEVLKLKQSELMHLDRDTEKLRFLIGMREGETAQLQRELDYVNGLKGSLEGRQLFDQEPGGAARPPTPTLNEIDGSAKLVIKDLAELERDLKERMETAEKMGVMVQQVAAETKKRILYEESLNPVFADSEAQTAFELADMETVCALDQDSLSVTESQNEDPWLVVQKIRDAHRGKLRFQMWVPECFKEVVLDSRRWLQEKEEKEARLAALISNPADISCKLISLLFSKMHDAASDAAYAAAHAAAYAAADAASGARRAGAGAGAGAAGGASGTSGLSISSHPSSNLSNAGAAMTHHIHEMNLQAAGHVGGADLETMDLVAALEHPSINSNNLVRLFGRLCGLSYSTAEPPLPRETLYFVLDVLYLLHTIWQEQSKRAKMSAKERSEKKALTDEQIFNKKFEAVGDDANSIILTLRVGESIAFKKAQVCKVVKESMASRARFTSNEGELLNFQEANRLLALGDALEYAVGVYEEVRRKRRANLKEEFRQISASGNLSYTQFHDLVLSLDPLRPTAQVRHMFREMAVRSGSGGASGGSDRIDIDCFCSVLQEHELDRPAACYKRTNSTDQQAPVLKCWHDVVFKYYLLVLKGADPYMYSTNASVALKNGKALKSLKGPSAAATSVAGSVASAPSTPIKGTAAEKADTRTPTRISLKDKK